MKKKVKKEPPIRCIAYLSTIGDMYSTEIREEKQLRYLKDYASGNNIQIVKIMHRDVLGWADVDRHFQVMMKLIMDEKADGILVANMKAVARNLPEAYLKVGKVVAAGGQMVTVDEGRLVMSSIVFS